jgi:hypothetical protein
MPEFIGALKEKIQAHNKDSAPYFPYAAMSIEDQLLDSDRRAAHQTTKADLEENIRKIQTDVKWINNVFTYWAHTIQFHRRSGIVPRASCCPTVGTIVRELWSDLLG